MIQNLRLIFSHKEITVFTAIFFVILFLIFPFKKYNVQIVQRVIAACCLWWILIVFIYPPKGFNYEIYSYNASLTLSGQNAFDKEIVQLNDKLNVSPSDSKFLDYTGSQHLLYVCLESLNLSKISKNLYGLGFQLWTIVNITIILLLIFQLGISSKDEIDANRFWPIIIVALCPIIPFYLIISSWEDKLIFLLLPLLLLLLIRQKKYRIASFSCGFIIAFNGLFVFLLPIYIIYLLRIMKKYFWINLGFILLGLIIGMIPFFPESLSGWENRFIRVDTNLPFWFSFYTFLPEGIYSSTLNNLIIFIISLITIIFYWLRKINFIDAMLISVSIVIIFSPFNVVSRVIPLILLFSILSPNMTRANWIGLTFILFIFLLFNNGYMTPIVNIQNTILFYIPLLYSFIIYLYKRIVYSHQNLEIDYF